MGMFGNLFKSKKEIKEASYMNQRRNILGNGSNFQVQEAYKALRTNIRFSSSGNKFCVTSGLASEGKSITVLNIAISFAEAGQKVLLIDADLRRPSQARLLIENGAPGLSNVLAGLCDDETAIRKEQMNNLDVMFSGEIPPNPSELLSSPAMEDMLKRLESKYDYIFIDTPPVNIVTDACVVGRLMDGVLFVVRQNQTDRESVKHGVAQLNMAGVKILGFVFNGADVKNNRKYKRYKYYKSKIYGYQSYRHGVDERGRGSVDKK